MEIAVASVNRTCCAIINNLLLSLECLSSPIEDLTELFDGSALVEIIENFENAFGLFPHNDGNYIFIKKWFTKQGIYIGRGRSIEEILKGNQFSHVAMLCYAIATIFLKNDQYLRKQLKNYKFRVDDHDMIEIVLFTKWKLCEEEIEVKDQEIERKNHYINEIANQSVLLRNEIVELKNKIVVLQNEIKKNEEDHKTLVARLIAELSFEKFKQREEIIEYDI